MLVDVYVNGPTDDARTALEQQGMQITADSTKPGQHIVSGWLPAARAPDVARLGITRSVTPVLRPRVFGVGPGSVTSLGDLRMNGPVARSTAAVNGAGVTVGVISDSFNALGGMAQAQATSDLPPNVQILAEGPANGSDEGQAMGQLLYDTAPGVTNMLFATGFADSASGKADNIKKLVDAGARVITDDTAFIDQPFFQDGVVEQAVDAARDRGVAYFAAGGNSAREAWEEDFRPTPGQALVENFDQNGGVDTRQFLGNVPSGSAMTIITQWDEAWNSSLANGLTMRLYTAPAGGSPVVACGGACTNSNAATIPEVFLEYRNQTVSSQPLYMELSRANASTAPHIKTVFYPSFNGLAVEHPTNTATVGPDASAAAGAITLAAVDQADPGLDTAESFSSRGPLPRYFTAAGTRIAGGPILRRKPEIAAPDGGATTVFGFECLLPNRHDCFFGTSAASPAAAGVATLLWSANPALPLSELRKALTDPLNTIDCLPTIGPDDDCGAGFLLADRALAAIDRTPPVVTAILDPPTPDGDGGWYRSDVDVSWTHSDPDTPATVSGCAPAEILTDGVSTLPCSVTSAGGTTSVPVTIRHDATPPSAPGFTGIAAQTYTTSGVPPAAALGCLATDATSGVAACTVTGYDASIGTHRLTATATDRSGLSTSSTLDYTVTAVPPVPPKAASRLSIPSLSLGALRSRGLKLSLRTARASTKFVATLTAKLPGARRSSTVGRLTKTTGAAGTQSLRVTLSRRARNALARSRKVTVTAAVVATAPGATKVTLKASRSVRR